MHIDCDDCAMQASDACGDCLVTFLVDGGPLDLHDEESTALSNLADAGLVAPLRLVPLQRNPRDAAAS
ncbi:MAG: hypothetical protein HKN07_11575 [Acidimicrobiia bacterium]|nr:hypothetical protein [Acidimicrobiia bacterium]